MEEPADPIPDIQTVGQQFMFPVVYYSNNRELIRHQRQSEYQNWGLRSCLQEVFLLSPYSLNGFAVLLCHPASHSLAIVGGTGMGTGPRSLEFDSLENFNSELQTQNWKTFSSVASDGFHLLNKRSKCPGSYLPLPLNLNFNQKNAVIISILLQSPCVDVSN